jgi:hypothetical protein
MDLGIGSWKTGEGIAIVAGGAISTMILAAAAAVVMAAAAVGVAAMAAERRAIARARGLRSSRLAHR